MHELLLVSFLFSKTIDYIYVNTEETRAQINFNEMQISNAIITYTT